MKYLLLFMLLGYGGLWAQNIEGGYLKLCADLKDKEAQIACTDSILLEDVRRGWSEIKNEIEPGDYLVVYTISSNGIRGAERILLLPQRVVFNSKPKLLLELVDRSVKKHEWISPKWDSNSAKEMKINRIDCGIQRNLKINTTRL